MRIKLFEEYNNRYYTRLDNNLGLSDETFYSFSENEVKEISSYFLNPEILTLSSKGEPMGMDYYDGENIITLVINVKREVIKGIRNVHGITTDELKFNKLGDEWYMIRWVDIVKSVFVNKYYKCDQWDGLLNWLEDFPKIK